ncbi:hypothetical protein PR048_026130 [Dryococelus australis]|uniref:Uncharacterized protein n=1 Tax=Dryococelus australis TaxID=614101 RepID=A0ABQ9GKH5_9NEOP|nr:hypothetical protein PR048_026130 [Dryococelus australis]
MQGRGKRDIPEKTRWLTASGLRTCMSKVKERGSDTGDTNTHAQMGLRPSVSRRGSRRPENSRDVYHVTQSSSRYGGNVSTASVVVTCVVAQAPPPPLPSPPSASKYPGNRLRHPWDDCTMYATEGHWTVEWGVELNRPSALGFRVPIPDKPPICVTVPATWWPALPPPGGAKASKTPPRVVQVSFSVLEPRAGDGEAGCAPRVQIQPVTPLASVALVAARAAYRELRADDVISLLLPHAPLYPLSRLHLPVYVRHHAQRPVALLVISRQWSVISNNAVSSEELFLLAQEQGKGATEQHAILNDHRRLLHEKIKVQDDNKKEGGGRDVIQYGGGDIIKYDDVTQGGGWLPGYFSRLLYQKGYFCTTAVLKDMLHLESE